jgi:hypothetical protein
MMKLFKQSLMKNQKLNFLNFSCDLFQEYAMISHEALDIFLNYGNWTNKTLKMLCLDCKSFYLNLISE